MGGRGAGEQCAALTSLVVEQLASSAQKVGGIDKDHSIQLQPPKQSRPGQQQSRQKGAYTCRKCHTKHDVKEGLVSSSAPTHS